MMRNLNISHVLLAFVVSALFLAQGASAAEIIQNGGFEDGMTGWTLQVNNAGSATITDTANSGSQALRIVTSPLRSSVYLYQGISPSSASYTLSVWLRFERGGQEIALSNGWIPERGPGLALRLILLPGTPEWEIQLQGGGQAQFAKWLYWGIEMDRWYNFVVVTDDVTKKRTLYIDGQKALEVGLTESIIPNMIWIGYTGKEFDEPDYHPPTYLLGGSSVVWDDISLDSSTIWPGPSIPILPPLALPAGLASIVIVAWKRRTAKVRDVRREA